MFPTKFGRATALILFALPLARSQLVSSLPQCVQDCITQSQDDDCSVSDIACLCRASAGTFLPDLITCMHDRCDGDLDINMLLTPLQYLCEVAGASIPESALQSAENEASSLAAQVTTTVTMASTTESAQTTTTIEAYSTTTATVTTTQSGSIIALAIPITEWSTTTVSGPPSTVTVVSDSNGFTAIIPVIITSTDSSGSTYTTTTSEPGAISTYTTTVSGGSTTTQMSTFTTTQSPSSSSSSSSSGSAASDSVSSSTTVTTSIAAEQTTGTKAQTKTSAAPDSDATDSAPFTNTNASTRKAEVNNWMGLCVLLAVGCVCF